MAIRGFSVQRQDCCNYGAEIENLDRLFGQVLDAVHDRGNSVENDTVVCFFSDYL